jgi:hypothetical protein
MEVENLLYKLHKYQNKLEFNPGNTIYQQKEKYYSELIGGAKLFGFFGNSKPKPVQNLKPGSMPTTPIIHQPLDQAVIQAEAKRKAAEAEKISRDYQKNSTYAILNKFIKYCGKLYTTEEYSKEIQIPIINPFGVYQNIYKTFTYENMFKDILSIYYHPTEGPMLSKSGNFINLFYNMFNIDVLPKEILSKLPFITESNKMNYSFFIFRAQKRLDPNDTYDYRKRGVYMLTFGDTIFSIIQFKPNSDNEIISIRYYNTSSKKPLNFNNIIEINKPIYIPNSNISITIKNINYTSFILSYGADIIMSLNGERTNKYFNGYGITEDARSWNIGEPIFYETIDSQNNKIIRMCTIFNSD